MLITKKFIILSCLLIGIMFLSGCGQKQAKDNYNNINFASDYVKEISKNINPDSDSGFKVKPEDKTLLDLSSRGLTEFPRDALKRTEIKKLILSGNNLKTLPLEIGQLANIEELYLNNNHLEGALVAEIRQMSRLRVLDLSGNNMTGIPAEIGQLKFLEILNYKNNNLDTMPDEIENLKNLKTLNLAGNKYTEEKIKELQEKLPNTNIIY